MEYVWYVVASLLAGVGTGLAGLSAATVMVPLLFVLCPSFAGETGAYQATAIALASDILGSAITTTTYIRHGNIDLRRGGVMLACILPMCAVGSYASWLVGNVVLGSFTLFLTLCIGIRFLVRPDTTKDEPAPRDRGLDARGVAISVFFGLTIGFGTGFVGSGGGMMMLVVFTALLGMELKAAVGTSTFIMTFTALIASVSHIAIHPAIVWDRWDALLVCMAVSSATSLYSARFANRVDNRTVGLATGGILTGLGLTLLILHYWPAIVCVPVLPGVLLCLGRLVEYIIPCLVVLLLVRRFLNVPSYVFRKLLHVVAFTCVSLMILAADSWVSAALASCVVAIAVYPVLAWLEDEPWYGSLFVQKSPGEIKRSMVMLFAMFALVVAAAWGVFGRPELAAAAILMWGTGDGAAALVGIPFGRHKVGLRLADGKKSWEGSAAMLMVSFACGLAVLMACGHAPARAVIPALAGSVAGTAVELFSHSELDTVTVPIAILAVLLVLC
ncbi:MAG: TSUP family transporter [Coriobacteriales bacterium]|nr:TSUP family transporter [Coriobacteriales bacterium]